MAIFTAEELEELRQADAEIEDTFEMTSDDYARSREIDRTTKKSASKYDRSYYEKNRERIIANNKAYRNTPQQNGKTYSQNYYQAHKEEMKAKQRARNRANPNYHKEYRARKRQQRNAQKGNEE